VIVQLAGLPGSGKSTLATELVCRLGQRALLLDKDRIRNSFFGPEHTVYTRAQDDFCVVMMLRAAAWQLRDTPSGVVILDGRTCSRAYQVTQVRRFADRIRQPLRLIECVCTQATIEKRLQASSASGTHPAANRGIRLYRQLLANADPIPEPKLRLNTDKSLRNCADQAVHYITHPLPIDSRRSKSIGTDT